MVGELLAAGEGTQTKSLWILQPSHLLGSGSTTTPTTTLSPQSGLTSTWGKNGVPYERVAPLMGLEPSTGLEPATSRLRSERTTSYASMAGA